MITLPFHHLGRDPELNSPVTDLKGIGGRRGEHLCRKGLKSFLDLLALVPLRYEDRSSVREISVAGEGRVMWVRGRVMWGREDRFYRSGKRLFRILIEDDTGQMELLWFHYRKAHLTRFSEKGREIMAYGSVGTKQHGKQMIHPDIILCDDQAERSVLGIYPVYPAVDGVPAQVLRSAISQVFDRCVAGLEDPLPEDLLHRLGLPTLEEALRAVHMPGENESVDELNDFRSRFQKRLIFDHFFHVMLKIALRRKMREKRKGQKFSIPMEEASRLVSCFPFSLTNDQVRAIKEIFQDLQGGRPMNRLLQGDVGCGKTVVAAVASSVAILNNRQVALMVPTQVLARQHYATFSSLANKMGFSPVLLTGNLKGSERQRIYEQVQGGEYNVVIGTQALIQEELSYARLGLVVIDEQHRFGVRQRALLDQKGANPHLLVMTATPIPRTLALTVYGDLDISVIREYPAGRRSVKTYLLDEGQKRRVYQTVRKRIQEGQQAVVICPAIEGSEETELKNVLDMHANLKRLFPPPFRLGLIHGRLSPEKKDSVMEEFRTGSIDLLVGTTVVEVGVHAPGATVMVVEHPERFGLTQLHQLRGRVGRGSEGGICILMRSGGLSDKSLQRLELFLESCDGFEIAEKDLEMRGQGELMGMRQAGAGELDLRLIFREPELLELTKRETERIVESDERLERPEHQRLRAFMQHVRPEPEVSDI
jgi:ATP-dependent DNA helicase RecG